MAFQSRNERNVFVGNVGGGNMQISVRDDRGRPHFNRRDDHHKGSRNRDDGFRGGHNSNSRIPEGHWRGGGRGRGGRRGQLVSYDDLLHEDRPKYDRQAGRMEQWRGARGNRNYKRNRGNDRYKIDRTSQAHSSLMGWQKISVCDASQHDPAKVLEELQSSIGEAFECHLLACDGNNVNFYLEDNQPIGRSLGDLSKRFSLPGSNHRHLINVTPATPPFPPPTVDNLEKVKLVLGQRYNEHMKRLDLSEFHKDPNFKTIGLLFPLYQSSNLSSVGRLIAENVPNVVEIDLSKNKLTSLDPLANHLPKCKSLSILNLMNNKLLSLVRLKKLTGLPISEVVLEGNPVVASKYKKSFDSYISDVRAVFPNLISLDGKELPRPIGFEVDAKVTQLPPSLPSFAISEDAKALMKVFVAEYCKVLEIPDRSPLKAAFCEDAIFSVSILSSEASSTSYNDRNAEKLINRNLKVVQQSEDRNKLLFRGQEAIVKVLDQCFPGPIEHDYSSFVMDIPLAVPGRLTQCVVTGLYRPTAVASSSKSKNSNIKAFQRSLIVVPHGSGHCIANEQLFVTAATFEQIKAAFQVPVAVNAGPSSAPSGGLEPIQLQMIEEFAKHSRMKPEFCKECLETSSWDFNKAAERFVAYKNEGKIPSECFLPQS